MDNEESLIADALMAGDNNPTDCAICDRPLGYSIDDQPNWPTGPMCGDCYQSRQMDDEISWAAIDDNE